MLPRHFHIALYCPSKTETFSLTFRASILIFKKKKATDLQTYETLEKVPRIEAQPITGFHEARYYIV